MFMTLPWKMMTMRTGMLRVVVAVDGLQHFQFGKHWRKGWATTDGVNFDKILIIKELDFHLAPPPPPNRLKRSGFEAACLVVSRISGCLWVYLKKYQNTQRIQIQMSEFEAPASSYPVNYTLEWSLSFIHTSTSVCLHGWSIFLHPRNKEIKHSNVPDHWMYNNYESIWP